MDFPKRKQIRLQDYGYSAPGAYFVTVCTQDRRCILSEIRRGDLWSPAAFPNLQDHMNMVWHDHIRIHRDIFIDFADPVQFPLHDFSRVRENDGIRATAGRPYGNPGQ